MDSLSGAKKVIKDLKKQGFEAYIVGGAVRDHLLGMAKSDIDITTNARPFEVAKIFKTVPTGLKYGTVTVLMDNEKYEVTTYRIDNDYIDNRHPVSVTYSTLVTDDVNRRDFTINGLLMDENEEIYDFVSGKKDLERKIIKAIGDPNTRFQEDALRMLRAIYFQSKLGFQIDKETREAIKDNRFLLKEVSFERIEQELYKIFKGKYLKRAIQSIVTTNIHEVLPGLEKGFNYIKDLKEMPYMDIFYIIAFSLNGNIPKEYKFSNVRKHKYEIASKLVRENKAIDEIILYNYGLEISILANKASAVLKRSSYQKTKITEMFNNLPLKSELDLKLRGSDLIKLANKKAGSWVNELTKKMVNKVLNKEIKNDFNDLKDFVLKELENMEK